MITDQHFFMKSWLRLRQYIHISPKFNRTTKKESEKSKAFITSYVSNKAKIEKHKFSPLLHYKIIDHRFRRDPNEVLPNGKTKRKYKFKDREIYYANHLDAQVFAYYANLINKQLKIEYAKNEQLDGSVIGYRRIYHSKKRNKSTIDFASEVFEYIRNHKSKEITVVCLDVSKFFDSIDHKKLKESWCNLYNKQSLDKHEYCIYKAITRATYLDLEKLLKVHPNFDVKNLKYISNSKRSSLFRNYSELRFLNKKYGLFRKYNLNSGKGIPQGTPISAVLSNMYFLSADKKIVELVNQFNGIYRRYSDDILIVCESKHVRDLRINIENIISNDLDLKIQTTKTLESNLYRENVENTWSMTTFQHIRPVKKPISYLGFDYDGEHVRIRNSSLSKYYRGLKRMIRRSAFYARLKIKNNKYKIKKDDEWIYRTTIFKSKSHLGAKKAKINGVVRWGNYISFIKNAANNFDLINRKIILKQVRNHWKIINSHIKAFENRYNLPKPPISKHTRRLFKIKPKSKLNPKNSSVSKQTPPTACP